jgi:hypothetical protein
MVGVFVTTCFRDGTDHDPKPLPLLPGIFLQARLVQSRQEEYRGIGATQVRVRRQCAM